MTIAGAVAATIAGEAVWLMPERALYWPAQQTLFVADVHLGKAATFRRAGIALPPGSNSESLLRLSAAIGLTAATRLVVLGDLLHSVVAKNPHTLAALAEFRQSHAALELVLVRGNHDDKAGDPPPALGIHLVDEPHALGTFALCHAPQTVTGLHALAGHIHPAVQLRGKVDSARVACFWLGENTTVLPAFGAFTGTWVVTPKQGDRLYPVADGRVFGPVVAVAR
jgi:DNA ligase-associated metallophosphoesterase